MSGNVYLNGKIKKSLHYGIVVSDIYTYALSIVNLLALHVYGGAHNIKMHGAFNFVVADIN